MLLGRLSRVAHRTSSVYLSRTFRPVVCGFRQYSATAAQPAQTSVQEPLTPLDFVPDEIFTQYDLPKNNQNLALIRVLEMVREAEALITSNDAFDTAEAMLTGALDFIAKNGIKDSWAIGSAHANLAYVLQQTFKYDAAMSNYGIGLQNLSKEPIRDPRFVGLRQLGFAELLSLQGQHAMAATTCQAAIGQLEKVLKDTDPLVGIANSNLAAYRMLEGKPNLAIPYAEKGLQILEATLGKHNDVTRNCAVNIAKLYKELGRAAEIQTLDSKFLEEDQPLLAPQTGNYAPEYLQNLKNKWKKQGPRKIFDPPGLHRSASLSANSYNAFVKAWKAKGLPISGAAAGVLSAEFRSLEYSHDQLKRHIGRPLPKEFRDAPEKFKTGFEKLKLKGLTSLAAQLDKSASLPPLLPEDVVITEQEWRDAAERQRSYRAAHGDPQFEAAQEEFSRSEAFFEGIGETIRETRSTKSVMDDDYEDDIEMDEMGNFKEKIDLEAQALAEEKAEQQAEIDAKSEARIQARAKAMAKAMAAKAAAEAGVVVAAEVEQNDPERILRQIEEHTDKAEAVFARLEDQDDAHEDYLETWDRDTYDAYTAVHGGPAELQKQSAQTKKWLESARFTKNELTEEDNAPLSSLSDKELYDAAERVEHGSIDRELLLKMYSDLEPPGILSNNEEDLKKPRPLHENPHYLLYRKDYFSAEGVPTDFEVIDPNEEVSDVQEGEESIDEDEDEDEVDTDTELAKGEETEEEEDEGEIEEVNYEDLSEEDKKEVDLQLKMENSRVAIRTRPDPDEVEDAIAAEGAEDDYDPYTHIDQIKTDQAAWRYKEKLRKKIAAGEPTTPEMESEQRFMDYEKYIDVDVRATIKAEVQAEIDRRKAKKAAMPVDPYDFNPEEDDILPLGENEKPLSDADTISRLKEGAEFEEAQTEKKHKYGKLHETPWHDDFEST